VLPGQKVWLRAWQVQVGRVVLYLLDSNDPANPPAFRGITSELYGGGAELRLQQELLLGIGGWRLLRTLRLEPRSVTSTRARGVRELERARSFMEDTRRSFEVALAVTRAGMFSPRTPRSRRASTASRRPSSSACFGRTPSNSWASRCAISLRSAGRIRTTG